MADRQARPSAAIRQRPKTPLVEAPPPGHSAVNLERLCAFVWDAPGLDRFVDRKALVSAMTEIDASTARQADRELVRPLGLAQWLVHWSRPRPRRDNGTGDNPLTV